MVSKKTVASATIVAAVLLASYVSMSNVSNGTYFFRIAECFSKPEYSNTTLAYNCTADFCSIAENATDVCVIEHYKKIPQIKQELCPPKVALQCMLEVNDTTVCEPAKKQNDCYVGYSDIFVDFTIEEVAK